MNTSPRLSIGLPVFNGETYLSESLDSLMGQSYTDFELIISDNASTDSTEEICRQYAALDSRIRYVRQPSNIGSAPNHNLVARQAGGELFKWAAHDDLYGRDLLLRCIEQLDAHCGAVLCHANYGIVDGTSSVAQVVEYQLGTDSPHAPDRFHSMLFGVGGEDIYGVIRTDVLRRTPLHGSYHLANRVLEAELALNGTFRQVQELLFFHRRHPRQESAQPTKRAQCASMDPRRADRLRHPVVRLLTEYVFGFADAIRRAPITRADKAECFAHLRRYVASRVRPTAFGQTTTVLAPVGRQANADLAMVPGQRRASN